MGSELGALTLHGRVRVVILRAAADRAVRGVRLCGEPAPTSDAAGSVRPGRSGWLCGRGLEQGKPPVPPISITPASPALTVRHTRPRPRLHTPTRARAHTCPSSCTPSLLVVCVCWARLQRLPGPLGRAAPVLASPDSDRPIFGYRFGRVILQLAKPATATVLQALPEPEPGLRMPPRIR